MNVNCVLVIVLLQFPIASASVGGQIGETSFGKVIIRKFHVTSRITSRFASTEVVSVVANRASHSKEVKFEMEIPETAFTTKFTLKIGNETYSGKVQEKKDARRTYATARESGKTAGHVAARPRVREADNFQVSMNVEAGAEAHFVLTYQEMLFRRRGIYEHRISIRQNQVIEDLKVEVFITEPQGIAFIQVPPIQSRAIDRWVGNDVDNSLATIKRPSPERAHIVFSPSREEQTSMSSNGVMGDFVVRYDVMHEFNAGELQVLGSYFVHHFAPIGLKPARKNVVFVIDVSGSMAGQKLLQTKSALKQMLGDMRENDLFNIVTFSGGVSKWQNQLVPASEEFRQEADDFLDNLSTLGLTNINSALLAAVDILDTHHANEVSHLEKAASMIIMLTDGIPTIGVQRFKRIQKNVKSAVRGRYSIFCLGFGDDVDYDALEILSLQNNGVARKIFEDADASLQLKGFYDEVANPVLFNLDISYPSNIVDQGSLTTTTFPVFYDGSEIVVAGKLSSLSDVKLQTKVIALSFNDSIQLETQVSLQQESIEGIGIEPDDEMVHDVTQRFWVYLTIKQLLDEMKLTKDKSLRNELKQKVVDLSIEYNFVTDVTSLVVVADDDYHSTWPSTTIAPVDDSRVWALQGPQILYDGGSVGHGNIRAPPSRRGGSVGHGNIRAPPSRRGGSVDPGIRNTKPSSNHFREPPFRMGGSVGHGNIPAPPSRRGGSFGPVTGDLVISHLLGGLPQSFDLMEPPAPQVPILDLRLLGMDLLEPLAPHGPKIIDDGVTDVRPSRMDHTTTTEATTRMPFTQVPTTTTPSSSASIKDSLQALSDVYLGTFGGQCEVGVKLQSLDPIVCFRVPNDFFGVKYSLFEIQAGVNITGSFAQLKSAHYAAATCLKSKVIIGNFTSIVAINATTLHHGSEQCDAIHISLSAQSGQTIHGLVARLVSEVPLTSMQSYNVHEINGVKLVMLSSQDGHFKESLFEPM
ncbi:inter-alpha-trypsin inhibitor heavy chain H3-like isoform X2 [Ptychodera flava]|uniref:inter-alpha-trypsin inhibitor heavy chain H3-like isoform X2 n=1 Tax=Ptychodera flava TaxID=63121 RepID=UPI00396A5824